MKYKPVAVLALLGVITVSTIFASGNDEYTSRDLDQRGFDAIHNSSFFDIELSFGPEYSVIAHGIQEHLDRLQVEVRDGQLILDVESGFSFSFGFNSRSYIEITMPQINGVVIDGSGDLDVLQDLETPSLTLELNGSGDFAARGETRVDSVDIKSSGSGDTSFGLVLANRGASFGSWGSGDVEIESLEAPAIDIQTNGSGSMDLSGTIDFLRYTGSGSGDLSSQDLLVAIAAAVSTNGSGSVDISFANDAEVELVTRGSGDINYWGQPLVREASELGSGDIRGR